MTTPARFYDSEQMTMIANLFASLKDLFREFEGEYGDNDSHPLYIWSTEIVIRHKDDYTVGRLTYEDDQLIFEITDENYGVDNDKTPSSDVLASVVGAAIAAHVRQEDTASGQNL